MEPRELNSPAFPQYTKDAYSTKIAGGISKIELIAALIYAQGEKDCYESAKDAVKLLQACEDIFNALNNPPTNHTT